MTENEWRKSSHSHQATDCVEVDRHLRRVRDSKNPSAVLTVDVRSLVAHLRTA
ncbi:DUF397 domain-containing protein [Actinosynnema sp. ALI-1.44]|uniref:DUF397 domain-containing protein n=1 Tax=Actinosynnema sp. ALI-1.44 TaxID=1933779 RepID=UPI001177C189|nr:DUF397 domain-containing protein [Actinosynnema sp. ALI-1.44]